MGFGQGLGEGEAIFWCDSMQDFQERDQDDGNKAFLRLVGGGSFCGDGAACAGAGERVDAA